MRLWVKKVADVEGEVRENVVSGVYIGSGREANAPVWGQGVSIRKVRTCAVSPLENEFHGKNLRARVCEKSGMPWDVSIYPSPLKGSQSKQIGHPASL